MSTLAQVVIPLVRQIVKTSNDQDLTDDQIIGYLDQFVRYDMPAEIELLDLKSYYSFETTPFVDKYNVPVHEFQFYNAPLTVDGLTQAWIQSVSQWINYTNPEKTLATVATADGSATGFTFNIFGLTTVPQPTFAPFVRAHYTWNKDWTEAVVISTLDANGNKMVVRDGWTPIDSFPPAQGQPSNANVGWLTENGVNQCGTVNYVTGDFTVQFSSPPAADAEIVASVLFFSPGLPCGAFFYENYIQLYPIPKKIHTIKVTAQKTPAAYFTSSASLQYTWMAEYFARGAAQKILSYVMDITQFNFYQPLFKEQERYVLRRTTRQNATQRTYTPYANQVENKQINPFGPWRWF